MRSVSVSAGFLAALSLSLTGCGDDDPEHKADEQRRCVNDQNVVVDQKECDADNGGNSHWYYGGLGYALGSLASGGGRTSLPPTQRSNDNGGAVSRGGIGSTGGGGTSDGSAGS